MPRFPFSALLLALCSACRAHGVGPRGFVLREHAPRQAPFDVLHYELALALEPHSRSLTGEATVHLAARPGQPMRALELDFVGLTVESVRDERGRALAFEHEDGTLAIELVEPLGASSALSVRYHGAPSTGLWYSAFDADGIPTQVFTHGQTEGSRGWFPCFDAPSERASVALTLDVPAEWTTVGPGARVASVLEGARKRERWELDFPHPSYLVSFVAGEFVVREGAAGATPLLYLCAARHEAYLDATFAATDEALPWLAEFAGTPYPYAKYAQSCVDNFPWGGMENISATTLTPSILGDERLRRDGAPDGLIVHEAAHQWFGDLVTCADWSHLWLNEGFATYLALLWTGKTQGSEAFLAELRETQEANLREDAGEGRRPTVWNVWKEPDDVFDTRPYGGAAVRLHLLRGEIGDEAFLAGVRAYVAEHAGRSVVTDDLRRAFERASGRDLGSFFSQWFLGAGFPELEVAWSYDEEARELEFEVEQVQEPDGRTSAVFTLTTALEVYLATGTRRVPLVLDERRERVRIPLDEAPLALRFDPDERIPERLHQERARAEWLVLARRGGVNARREAALALARLAQAAHGGGRAEVAEECAAEVRQRLAADPSEWVRADAATALGLVPDEDTRAALLAAASADAAARVRVAAFGALRAFGPDAGLSAAAEDGFAAGFSYATQAAAAALFITAAPERGFDFLRDALELDSPHDVLAARLLAVLAELADPRVPDELARRAEEKELAPTARAAAVDGLARAAAGGPELSARLAPLLAEESFHLRAAAVRALVASGDERARRELADYHGRSRTAEERRVIEAWLRHASH